MDADMQDIFGRMVLGNTLQAYLIAAVVFVSVLIIAWVVKRCIVLNIQRWTKATTTDIDDFLIGMLQKIGAPIYLVLALYIATRSLVLPASINQLIQLLCVIVITVRAICMLQDLLMFFLKKWTARTSSSDQTSAVAMKNIAIIVRMALWSAAILFMLDNLGINITAAVAGLGIGGVAVALAAQAVLGDMFSAFAIFIDRPFEVGDFIIVGDLLGTVEYIGFKTTRVRSLGGEQLIFSNSDLTGSRIRNYKRMQTRRIVFEIGVIYQTSVDDVKAIPRIIKDIVESHELATFDRSHFKSYGDFSFVFETVYLVRSSNYNTYMDIQQGINVRILEELAKRNITLAYPTQQVYHTQAAAPALS
jgi:small-conductance mechanosensitive channel